MYFGCSDLTFHLRFIKKSSLVRMRERVEREYDQDEEMKTHHRYSSWLLNDWSDRFVAYSTKQNRIILKSKRIHSRCEKQHTSKTKTAPLVQGIDGIEKLDCDLCRYAIASGPILK